PDADRHDDRQAPHGPALVLELAPPGEEAVGRELDLGGDAALGLGDEAAQVPAADVTLDADEAHVCLAVDGRLAGGDLDPGELAERDLGAVGGGDADVGDAVEGGARGLGEAYGDVEVALALPEGGRGLAADGGLDDVLDVGDVEAVAGDRLAVDDHCQLRHVGRLHDCQ